MLKQRVITAVAMASAFLALLFFAPAHLFIGVVGLVFALGAWEWSNLAGFSALLARVTYTVGVLVAALAAYFMLDSLADVATLKRLMMFACLWWAIALLWVQSYPASALLWRSSWMKALIGVLVLVPAWLAVAYLRLQEQGVALVLFVLLLVAAADNGAYFSGRAFGGRKLAPAVSPGKTWAGVWGGLPGAMVVGLLYGFYVLELPVVFLLFFSASVAAVSVLGDLLESMFKRERGIKDSSHILPGHGGILDRLDGIVAALPVAVLLLLSSL